MLCFELLEKEMAVNIEVVTWQKENRPKRKTGRERERDRKTKTKQEGLMITNKRCHKMYLTIYSVLRPVGRARKTSKNHLVCHSKGIL